MYLYLHCTFYIDVIRVLHTFCRYLKLDSDNINSADKPPPRDWIGVPVGDLKVKRLHPWTRLVTHDSNSFSK